MNYENGDVINPFPEVLKSHKKGLPDRNKDHYHSHNNNILGNDAFFSIWIFYFNVMLEYIQREDEEEEKKLFAEEKLTPPSLTQNDMAKKWYKEKKERRESERMKWKRRNKCEISPLHWWVLFSFFFCFVGTDNSTVTTISIFGWEHILIEASEAKKEQKRMRKSIQLAIKANIKIIWY